MSKIIIIGAGAMGSAFTIPCIENGNDVTLIGTHLENNLIDEITRERQSVRRQDNNISDL